MYLFAAGSCRRRALRPLRPSGRALPCCTRAQVPSASRAYPYSVCLQITRTGSLFAGTYRCGGTLIAPNQVLTAAHCVFPRTSATASLSPVSAVVALIGWDSLSDWTGELSPAPLPGGAEAIPASKWLYHPLYSSTRYTNDIGLITLSLPSNFTAVGLDLDPASGLAGSGTAAVLLGYGSTLANTGEASDNAVSIPTQLQQAKLPVLSSDACAARWPYFNPALQVCAGNYSGGVDSCQGDSGGPLVASLVGAASGSLLPGPQIAITSYGDGCAQPGRVSVYTRVSAYASWLAASLPTSTPLSPASVPPGSSPELLPGPGATVCAQAWSNSSSPSVAPYPALLDCGTFTIVAVPWAFYGNPSGDCAGAQPGVCNSAAALAAAQKACVGKNSCRLARAARSCAQLPLADCSAPPESACRGHPLDVSAAGPSSPRALFLRAHSAGHFVPPEPLQRKQAPPHAGHLLRRPPAAVAPAACPLPAVAAPASAAGCL